MIKKPTSEINSKRQITPGFSEISCLILMLVACLSAQAQSGETTSTDNTSSPKEAIMEASKQKDTESSKAEEKENMPAGDFETFKLILDRNIFDPDRRGPREQRRERPPEPPREESFTLLGTMFYANKQLAFFDGTDTEWAGAVKMGESVAGHKLTKIGFDAIELEWNGESIELTVGSARAKRGDDPWSTQSGSDWSGNSGSSSSRSSSGRTYGSRQSEGVSDSETSGGDAPAPNLEANDILKQMMERRRQSQGQ